MRHPLTSIARRLGLGPIRGLVLGLLLVLGVFSAAGGRADPVEDLAEALRIDELLGVVREEGLANAAGILPTSPSGDIADATMREVEKAFALAAMQADMRAAFRTHMDPDMMEEAAAFFAGDVGGTLINMELSARRAIMDPEIEEMARGNWKERAGKRNSQDAHFAAIKRFARVNDLVTRNAEGTMVARFEYLLGLAKGSGRAINEDAALADIWSREDEIVDDSEGWLMGFLLLAYGPLPTDHVDAYTDFSRRPAGAALNDALFDGFEVAYRRISFELGRIAGHAASARDL